MKKLFPTIFIALTVLAPSVPILFFAAKGKEAANCGCASAVGNSSRCLACAQGDCSHMGNEVVDDLGPFPSPKCVPFVLFNQYCDDVTVEEYRITNVDTGQVRMCYSANCAGAIPSGDPCN